MEGITLQHKTTQNTTNTARPKKWLKGERERDRERERERNTIGNV